MKGATWSQLAILFILYQNTGDKSIQSSPGSCETPEEVGRKSGCSRSGRSLGRSHLSDRHVVDRVSFSRTIMNLAFFANSLKRLQATSDVDYFLGGTLVRRRLEPLYIILQ